MSRIAKSRETENKLVVTPGWGGAGIESDCLMGRGFPFGVINVSQVEMMWLLNIVNVINATGLLTLKWLFLCYVNFTSIRTTESSAALCALLSLESSQWIQGKRNT